MPHHLPSRLFGLAVVALAWSAGAVAACLLFAADIDAILWLLLPLGSLASLWLASQWMGPILDLASKSVREEVALTLLPPADYLVRRLFAMLPKGWIEYLLLTPALLGVRLCHQWLRMGRPLLGEILFALLHLLCSAMATAGGLLVIFTGLSFALAHACRLENRGRKPWAAHYALILLATVGGVAAPYAFILLAGALSPMCYGDSTMDVPNTCFALLIVTIPLALQAFQLACVEFATFEPPSPSETSTFEDRWA